MAQREFNRAVAQATGESISTINNMGFVPLTAYPVERQPQTVDWDEIEEHRSSVFPQRQRQTAVA